MENNKKNNILSFVLIAVLIVAVAALSFAVVKNINKENEITTGAPTQTETFTQNTTEENVISSQPTAQANVMTTVPYISETASEKTPDKNDICNEYNEAVNALKNYTGSVEIHKTENVNVEITEFSLPAPTDTINSIVQNIIPDSVNDYSFNNGIMNDENLTPITECIPPFGGNARLFADDTLEAYITESNGNKEMSIILLPDVSAYDGSATSVAEHLAKIGNPLDFSTLSMGPVSVSSAQMNYHDVKFTAQLDSMGRISVLTSSIPVTVRCTGGMSVFTADIGMNINVETVYTVNYK